MVDFEGGGVSNFPEAEDERGGANPARFGLRFGEAGQNRPGKCEAGKMRSEGWEIAERGAHRAGELVMLLDLEVRWRGEDDGGRSAGERAADDLDILASSEDHRLILRDRVGGLAGVDRDAVKGGLAAEPRGEGGFDRDIHAAPPGDMVARYSPGEWVSETWLMK